MEVDKKLILKNYSLLQDIETHCSDLQYRYRQYALYWVMGIFAAIGFLMSKDVGQLPFNQILIISGISIGGSIGLTLLWSLDIQLYQKLLDATYIEELELEDKYDFLPQIRHKMFYVTSFFTSPIKTQTNFYIGMILLAMGVSFLPISTGFHTTYIYFIVFKLIFLATVIIYIRKKSSKTTNHLKILNPKLEEKLKNYVNERKHQLNGKKKS